MGQSLSNKVLERHVIAASKMEITLQMISGDKSLTLNVLTGKILHDPIEVAADFLGSVKYLLVYNPVIMEGSSGLLPDSDGMGDLGSVEIFVKSPTSQTINKNESDTSTSQQEKKKILTYKDLVLLRRLCCEYEALRHVGSQGAVKAVKAGDKRAPSYDPDECSVCMDASIDIVLPCLHGYCSTCWEEWSSYSSTCPHCRGEVKEHSNDSAEDDIWQCETWREGDTTAFLGEMKVKLQQYVTMLPLNLTPQMMTSHRSVSRLSSNGRGGEC